MPFQIIEIESGFVFAGQFETPTAALACIAEMQTHTGLRYRMARVITDEWREREALRLRDGTYTPLPAWWTDAPWWLNSAAAAGHYAHRSQCGEMVAYTESADKGAADRQTRVLATRYLTRYFADRLTPQEIVAIGARFTQATETQLVIKDTAADFERVYTAAEHCSESSSYKSCMRYETATFGTPCHPASAYAGHGLAIAYAQCPDGSIPARAIVWPENMSFVRIYGIEESDKHNLLRLLEDAGYTRADGFDGAKLSRIEFCGGDRVVVPYIDGKAQRLEDRGDYLIITLNGEIDGSSTAGWSELEDTRDTFVCENCGEREDDDNVSSVNGQAWCQCCADRDAFYCHASGEMYDNSVGSTTVITRWGREETWCDDACEGEAFHCEATDATYHFRYFTEIEVHVGSNSTETWCKEETADSYFYCEHTEEYYSTASYTPIDVNGAIWCEEETQDERDALAAEERSEA